jgi:hypothetical protein
MATDEGRPDSGSRGEDSGTEDGFFIEDGFFGLGRRERRPGIEDEFDTLNFPVGESSTIGPIPSPSEFPFPGDQVAKRAKIARPRVYWKCLLWRHKMVVRDGVGYCTRPKCDYFFQG